MKRRIDYIYDVIQIDTSSKLHDSKFNSLGVDAFTLALDTDYQRTNISKDMNILWKEGKLVKKSGRPTLFICRKSLEDFFPNEYFDSLLPSDYSFNISQIENTNNSDVIDEIMQIIPFSNQIKDTIVSLTSTTCGLPVVIESSQKKALSIYFEILEHAINESTANKYNFVYINYYQYDDITSFIKEVRAKASNLFNILIFENFDKADIRMIGYMFNSTSNILDSRNSNFKFIFTVSGKKSEMIQSLYNIIPYKFSIVSFFELDFVKKMKLLNYLLKDISIFFDRNISVDHDVFSFFFSLDKKADFNEIYNYLLVITSKLLANTSGNIVISYDLVRDIVPLKPELVELSLGFSSAFYDRTMYSNIDRIIADMNLSIPDKLIDALSSISFKISSIDKDIQLLSSFFSNSAFMTNTKNSQWVETNLKKAQFFFTESMDLHSLSKSESAKFALVTYAVYIDSLISNPIDLASLPDYLYGLVECNILKKKSYSKHSINLLQNLIASLTRTFDSTGTFLLLLLSEAKDFDLYTKVVQTLLNTSDYRVIISSNEDSDYEEITRIINDSNQSKVNYSYLILTDNFSFYKKRETYITTLMKEVYIMYPLTIPLIDSCISLIKQGSSLKDFSSINRIISYKPRLTDLDDDNSRFVLDLEEKVLKKDLKFLDTAKSTSLLLDSLSRICMTLKVPVDKRIIIKFVTHSSFMIERLLQNDAMNFDNLQNYYKKNLERMNYIKKELLPIERAFNINISPSELAFLNEIFSDYQS